MKKIFESVVLAEFVSNSGREPFMCFNPHCSHPSCNSLISNIQIF